MAVYAALLRGVNVGGKSLAMPDLQRLVERLGGRDVRTYLRSGNVVFTGARRLGAALEAALGEELGVPASVLLRSGPELAGVVARKPFEAGGSSVSVTFLASAPEASAVAQLDPEGYGADRFVVDAREVFLHTPNGYGRSKLGNAFWERALSTVATTRNWNTVLALAEMTGGG